MVLAHREAPGTLPRTATGTVHDARDGGSGRGPVFVMGRQHSGNTVLTMLLGSIPACLAQIDENSFFEHRSIVDRLPVRERADRVLALLRLERRELQGAVQEHLHGLTDSDPNVSALDLYRKAMDFVATALGKTFWAQKATSYIFYAREILTALPDARLLYSLRNPYDIVASRKRRHPRRERLWSTATGWNRGLRTAAVLAAELPARFRIVRYEDLTARPEETVRALLAWLDEPFDARYLDVPHVNRSETRYSLVADGKGLTTARVHYYQDNLTSAEIAGIDLLADRALLDAHYPALPHRSRRFGRRERAAGLALAASGPLRYAFDYVRRLWRQPLLLLSRTARRLGLGYRE